MRLAYLIAIACCATSVATAAEPPKEAGPPLDAREAGARYGQALGVALVCYGLRTTPAADRLASAYAQTGHDAFQAEADKVLAAWREASSCRNAGGPNPCRLVYEWSCRDAIREIGPQGSKIPGLVEEKSN